MAATRRANFLFEEQEVRSPLVEAIWRSDSGNVSLFQSVAVARWTLVVTRERGRTSVFLRGPETRPTLASCPSDAEFLGIVFALGTTMPTLPVNELVDGMLVVPDAGSRRFWVNGSAWETPSFENVDTFIQRLARTGLVVRDRLIASAAAGHGHVLNPCQRSVQRRYREVTGLTAAMIRQIDRARRAGALLRTGLPPAEVAHLLGYADQPHLTRAMRRYIGQTPGEISEGRIPLGRI